MSEELIEELREAYHTIKYLHNCLTKDHFEYWHPNQTIKQLGRISALLKENDCDPNDVLLR